MKLRKKTSQLKFLVFGSQQKKYKNKNYLSAKNITQT